MARSNCNEHGEIVGIAHIESVFAEWSDADLLDYEERLYDCELEGEETWEERDEVLWEMNNRGLCSGRGK